MKKYLIYIIFIISITPLTSRECFNDAYKQYENEDYNKSINSIMSCLNDIEEDADPVEMDHAYFGIASSYLKLGQLDSSLKYTLIAYNIETVNKLPANKTLNQLGNLYINKGLNHQAIYYLKKAVLINKSENNQGYLQKNYNNLGIAYKEIDLLDSSLSYYNLALSLTETDISEDNLIKNNLATLYFSQNYLFKAEKTLLEINEKDLVSNSEIDKYLILSNKVLFKLLTSKAINKDELTILNEYLQYCKERNDFYSADANFKLSIFTLVYKNAEEGIRYLNKANTIYVSVGNIGLAKQITSKFTKLMKHPTNTPFKYTLNDLNDKQIQIYSASLNSEIDTKLKAENYINDLNIKLNKAEFNYYITLSILISVLLFVGIIIQKVLTSNKIRQIVNGYLSYLNLINQLDSEKLRINLSKISNYMLLDESFKNKKHFTELVDEVVRDTNNIRRTVKEGIIFQQTKRLKDVNVTTTN